jgi:pimeloyl-ACP methyl ester carboxylesterase
MDIDIASCPGDDRKPAVILIHGLGMDRWIWEDSARSRILGGSLPISFLLTRTPSRKDYGYSEKRPLSLLKGLTTGPSPRSLRTIYHDLRAEDYPVITWSQKRPAGPLEAAASELSEVVPVAKRLSRSGIILIGHSRGGLIARKYLIDNGSMIKGLITISTPHGGSSIARLSQYVSPLVSAISPIFKESSHSPGLRTASKRVIDFLSSPAVRELLPDSGLIRDISGQRHEGLFCMTAGGTSPSLFRLYRWKWEIAEDNSRRRWFLSPEKILSLPDILEKIIPEAFIPDEIRQGLGDGLVSAERSRISWCVNHHTFPCNHAEILFDRRVRKAVMNAVRSTP